MQIQERNGRRYAVLTKIVHVPVEVIVAVRRSPTGGCAVVTDRGCNIVADAYEDVVRAVFGAEGGADNDGA